MIKTDKYKGSFKGHLASFLKEHYPEAYERVLLKREVIMELSEDLTSPFIYDVPPDDPFMINGICKEIQALEEDQLRKLDESKDKDTGASSTC